jgi:chaperonin cofactor prefoldin
MYRSLGRMFVAQDPKELGKDLDNDLKGINNELSRQNEILKNLAVKKEALTGQLNDLTPKTE